MAEEWAGRGKTAPRKQGGGAAGLGGDSMLERIPPMPGPFHIPC